MRKWIQNIIYFLTIAGIGVFIYFQKDKLHLITNLSVLDIIWLLFLNFLSIFLSSYIFKATLGFFNVHLKFNHWYGISVVNTMYNFILPFKGGLALRGIYLKKNFNLNYARYVSLIAGNYMIILLVSAIVGSVTGLFLYKSGSINQNYLLTISLGLLFTLVVGTMMFFAGNIRFKKTGRIYRIINQVLEGVGYFREHKSGLFIVLAVQALYLFAISYRLIYIFLALGIDATFTEILFIQALVIFSRIFAFTPGNIGLREGIVGLSASILGMDLETALLAALLDRIISIVYIFANGAFYSKILIEDLSLLNNNKKEDQQVSG